MITMILCLYETPELPELPDQSPAMPALRDLFANVVAFYCRHKSIRMEPELLNTLKSMMETMRRDEELARILTDAIACISRDISGLDSGVRAALDQARQMTLSVEER